MSFESDKVCTCRYKNVTLNIKAMKVRMHMTAAWAQKMFCYSPGGGHWGLFETRKLLKISIKTEKLQ